MGRSRIEMPDQFRFQATIPVRITDVNYGGHVGNDAVLSIIHEGRMQYLRQFGYTELECGGVSLIMSDVAIEFKRELFYGDTVLVSLTPTYVSRIAFDIFYKLETEKNGLSTVVALARSGMVCYNYDKKKVVAMTETLGEKLFGMEI